MNRKFGGPGRRTSDVEVTNVSKHGFWLLMGDRELYLSFDDFPWFRCATIDDLGKVELASPGHLRWPTLDIDLAIESINSPADFPLISKASLSR